MIIDAHAHLWKLQQGVVNGKPVYGLCGGKSMFGDEIRQMTPPYMIDSSNTAECLISNMDYAGVSGAVVTQEVIDGNQNEYLLQIKKEFEPRLKICSLYEPGKALALSGFDGVKICAGRLLQQDLTSHFSVFEQAEQEGKFISIDLSEGEKQVHSLQEVVSALPNLKIAIGHFGMVGRQGWKSQIKLAQNKNVFVESGGITWLFHSQFYPYPSAVKAVREAVDICGAEKLMWGSDYPRTMAEITYKMSFDFLIKSNEFSQEELNLILYENAREFYGFNGLIQTDCIKNMLED